MVVLGSVCSNGSVVSGNSSGVVDVVGSWISGRVCRVVGGNTIWVVVDVSGTREVG